MKIKIAGDETLDTDKMLDKDAEIHEAVNHLHQVCKKYNVTSFTRVLFNKDNFLGGQTAPNTPQQTQEDYMFLINNMCAWIERTTGARVSLD